MSEALGIVEDLHDEGDGGDISHVGAFGGAGAPDQDATEAPESVGDARTGVSFDGERARVLFCGNDRPLPRLLVLAGKAVAGVRRDIVRLADGRTSFGAILEDDQARILAGVERGQLDEGALGDLVPERHKTVDRKYGRGGAGVVQIDLVQEFLACVLVAYTDGVAAVVVGVELARIDLDDGEVLGVLTGFGGEDDGGSPGELPEYTVFLCFPVSGNLMTQGLELLQPILRLLEFPPRQLEPCGQLGVAQALNQLDPLLGIGDRGLLPPNTVVDGGELLAETGGAKDDHIFTRHAVALALVRLVVAFAEGEDNMSGSDKVDVLVVAAGADVEASGSLSPGPILCGDRDTEGRGVWVASGESRVGEGDGIKEPIARLSHNARLSYFYVAIADIVIVDERVAVEGDDATLLEAESPELDANPNDGWARGLSDFNNAERLDTSPVHVHLVQAKTKAVG